MQKGDRFRNYNYYGPLAESLKQFVEEKRAIGFIYNGEAYYLNVIDQLSIKLQLPRDELTQEFVEVWTIKRNMESHKTWKNRVIIIRQLAKYMKRQGSKAYVTTIIISGNKSNFTPHIYSGDELCKIFRAADNIPIKNSCPDRRKVSSVLFRMLYACGLRLSEALMLKVCDVDLQTGTLFVAEGKNGKNRIVPMSAELTACCVRYSSLVNADAFSDEFFFRAPDGSRYSTGAINSMFLHILMTAGISREGRGKGPRIHDFRHTFAVNCLKKWVYEGKDITAALPVLSAYLGHVCLTGTQLYLRLTADMFPSVTERLEYCFKDVIPERGDFDEAY